MTNIELEERWSNTNIIGIHKEENTEIFIYTHTLQHLTYKCLQIFTSKNQYQYIF